MPVWPPEAARLSSGTSTFAVFTGGSLGPGSSLALREQLFDVVPERDDGGVVGFEVAVGAGEHHRAFHRREHEDGDAAGVGLGRQPVLRIEETLLHRVEPVLEVLGQERPGARMGLRDLDHEIANRASVLELGHFQHRPIALQKAENALDRVGVAFPDRLQDVRVQELLPAFEGGVEEILLGREEVVERARKDAGLAGDLGEAGVAVALEDEEFHRGVDEPIAGVGGCAHAGQGGFGWAADQHLPTARRAVNRSWSPDSCPRRFLTPHAREGDASSSPGGRPATGAERRRRPVASDGDGRTCAPDFRVPWKAATPGRGGFPSRPSAVARWGDLSA